jgi:hypothetical protein
MELQGLTKDQIVNIIKENKIPLNSKNVVAMISSMKLTGGKYRKITRLKIGDIMFHSGLNHPALIISVRKHKIAAVLLTSNYETDGLLMACGSRYYDDSYITSTVTFIQPTDIYSSMMHPYDNRKEITQIRKLLSKQYKGIL